MLGTELVGCWHPGCPSLWLPHAELVDRVCSSLLICPCFSLCFLPAHFNSSWRWSLYFLAVLNRRLWGSLALSLQGLQRRDYMRLLAARGTGEVGSRGVRLSGPQSRCWIAPCHEEFGLWARVFLTLKFIPSPQCLGIKPRASHTVAKCSASEQHPGLGK